MDRENGRRIGQCRSLHRILQWAESSSGIDTPDALQCIHKAFFDNSALQYKIVRTPNLHLDATSQCCQHADFALQCKNKKTKSFNLTKECVATHSVCQHLSKCCAKANLLQYYIPETRQQAHKINCRSVVFALCGMRDFEMTPFETHMCGMTELLCVHNNL